MSQISFNWNFQPDKPNVIHCGHCGFKLTITPSSDELRSGFKFFCLQCGSPFAIAGREVKDDVQINREHPHSDETKPLPDCYPQTRRLFEKRTVNEWIQLATGVWNRDGLAGFWGSKFKYYYRAIYSQQPEKKGGKNVYSGTHFNQIINRMYVDGCEELNTLVTWRLSKIRREIVKGSVITGVSGKSLEVVDFTDGKPIVNTPQGLKSVSPDAIVAAIHPDPSFNL